MTLKKFFNTDNMVIKLDTKDELSILISVLSKLNITWASGDKLDSEYTEHLIEDILKFPMYFYPDCYYGIERPEDKTIIDFNSIDEFYEEEDLPYISVKGFFNLKLTAIHAGQKDVAIELLKLFDAAGYKWCSGESYVKNPYHYYDDRQCYSCERAQCDIDWYQDHYYKIYEVEDVVDLWKYPKVSLK